MRPLRWGPPTTELQALGLWMFLYLRAPRSVQLAVHRAYERRTATRYKSRPRPARAGETSKARPRREREGFFEKYCRGRGLDVGYGGDLLTSECTGWDVEDGDAQTLSGLPDMSFDFVYSSHTLEHVASAELALRNWARVLKPGGYLLLYLPERDLYEKKHRLPSRFNPDHKRFFKLEGNEPPDTVGVLPLLRDAVPGVEVVSAKICSDGHTIRHPGRHGDGEYSIEVIARKPTA